MCVGLVYSSSAVTSCVGMHQLIDVFYRVAVIPSLVSPSHWLEAVPLFSPQLGARPERIVSLHHSYLKWDGPLEI